MMMIRSIALATGMIMVILMGYLALMLVMKPICPANSKAVAHRAGWRCIALPMPSARVILPWIPSDQSIMPARWVWGR